MIAAVLKDIVWLGNITPIIQCVSKLEILINHIKVGLIINLATTSTNVRRLRHARRKVSVSIPTAVMNARAVNKVNTEIRTIANSLLVL